MLIDADGDGTSANVGTNSSLIVLANGNLTDPFPDEGERPVVAVEIVLVGLVIVDPWREAMRAPTRR